MNGLPTSPVTAPLSAFLAAMKAGHGGHLPLSDEQRRALEHDFSTPLWIIAGPGTGKTHTIVWLALKRLLVDGVLPSRLMLTTFTRKAARELESRLIEGRERLTGGGLPGASSLDVSQVLVGTLHSLCADILRTERYDPTLRILLLEDELTQQFFVRRTGNPLVASGKAPVTFWQRFGLASQGRPYAPNLNDRAAGAVALFNRLTENSIEPDTLSAAGDSELSLLAEGFDHYRTKLRSEYRTDQAHLQRHFLDFLQTPSGQAWLGDGLSVIVDEYQDTNPIQEQIYFQALGDRRDITVVGDDDQSLYRFRGATVESLVEFDRACRHYLGVKPRPLYLRENRRSDPKIVRWVCRFIEHHPDMTDSRVRVRAPGKPRLRGVSEVGGDYPAVMAICEQTNAAASAKVTSLVQRLMSENLLEDYSQVALLSFSTRETLQGIGPYIDDLRQAGIPVYNPRSAKAQSDPRLQQLLGALSTMLDPDWGPSRPLGLPRAVVTYVDQARLNYTDLVAGGAFPQLKAYVASSAGAVRRGASVGRTPYLTRPGGLRVTLSELFFKVLGHEPFATALDDPATGERLRALNGVLADYESLYSRGELLLESDSRGSARIGYWSIFNLYSVLVGGIQNGLNDPEDEEISLREGAVNAMTIHQAKGLEFEVVFVLRPDKHPFVGSTHLIEDELDPFVLRPTKPATRRTRVQRAEEDAVRLFFVAYSRAKRLLILTGTNLHRWDLVLGRNSDGLPVSSHKALEVLGVRFI